MATGYKWNEPVHNFSLKSPYPLTIENSLCWDWTGAKDKDGYGVFTLHGKKTPAHVAAYRLSIGEISEGNYVLHSCNNSSCVNPNHLYQGTQKENVQDQFKSGTFVYGENSGSAKLNNLIVDEIRKSLYSTSDLAKVFNVSYHTIWDIRKGRSWKHLLK